MEDKKFCPLCYCLCNTTLSSGALMCEKEKWRGVRKCSEECSPCLGSTCSII